MNLLLDTHVALWAITANKKLSGKARELIESRKSSVWVSAASIWEISIKHKQGRGDMPISGEEALAYFNAAGYRFLHIEPEHAAAVENLPGHHSDPFDRILVAQALVEPMRLITHDPKVALYSDSVIRV